jgi:hypothetical protein
VSQLAYLRKDIATIFGNLRLLAHAAVAACVLVGWSATVAGCDKTPGTHSSPSSQPPAHTDTTASRPASTDVWPVVEHSPGFDEMCDGLAWPRPMPAIVGQILDATYEFNQLACLNGLRAITPDGSILYERGTHIKGLGPQRIVAVSPPPGTPVGRDDEVTVTLVTENSKSVPPSGYCPCDWVSTTEAAGILGGPPVTAQPSLNESGSTDIGCDFTNSDSHRQVSSTLLLSGTSIVDAATHFAFRTAPDNATVLSSVSEMGIKAVCILAQYVVPVHDNKYQLWVLLRGERIYLASDEARHESCDALTQFAQAAIPRIGA